MSVELIILRLISLYNFWGLNFAKLPVFRVFCLPFQALPFHCIFSCTLTPFHSWNIRNHPYVMFSSLKWEGGTNLSTLSGCGHHLVGGGLNPRHGREIPSYMPCGWAQQQFIWPQMRGLRPWLTTLNGPRRQRTHTVEVNTATINNSSTSQKPSATAPGVALRCCTDNYICR